MKMIEIEIMETVEVFLEQKTAIIKADFAADVVGDAQNYEQVSGMPAYMALMDALEKYEKNPVGDKWFGTCPDDEMIVAVLERANVDAESDDEVYFTAVVHGNIS